MVQDFIDAAQSPPAVVNPFSVEIDNRQTAVVHPVTALFRVKDNADAVAVGQVQRSVVYRYRRFSTGQLPLKYPAASKSCSANCTASAEYFTMADLTGISSWLFPMKL